MGRGRIARVPGLLAVAGRGAIVDVEGRSPVSRGRLEARGRVGSGRRGDVRLGGDDGAGADAVGSRAYRDLKVVGRANINLSEWESTHATSEARTNEE